MSYPSRKPRRGPLAERANVLTDLDKRVLDARGRLPWASRERAGSRVSSATGHPLVFCVGWPTNAPGMGPPRDLPERFTDVFVSR